MRHLIKILKITNNKMNECQSMHIKVFLHIINYHLHYSYLQRFQNHCHLDPHCPHLLTPCNKCHEKYQNESNDHMKIFKIRFTELLFFLVLLLWKVFVFSMLLHYPLLSGARQSNHGRSKNGSVSSVTM